QHRDPAPLLGVVRHRLPIAVRVLDRATQRLRDSGHATSSFRDRVGCPAATLQRQDTARDAPLPTPNARRAASPRRQDGPPGFAHSLQGSRPRSVIQPQSVTANLISSELPFSSGAYIADARAGRALYLPGISARIR